MKIVFICPFCHCCSSKGRSSKNWTKCVQNDSEYLQLLTGEYVDIEWHSTESFELFATVLVIIARFTALDSPYVHLFLSLFLNPFFSSRFTIFKHLHIHFNLLSRNLCILKTIILNEIYEKAWPEQDSEWQTLRLFCYEKSEYIFSFLFCLVW